MAKYRITVSHLQVLEVNFGEMPEGMVKELAQHLADFNLGESGWSLGDLRGKEDWEVVDVQVEKIR